MTFERNAPCPCGSGKKYKHCCLLHREMPPQDSLTATPVEVKPQAGAVEKAMSWLATRHRKGWQVSLERLHDELLSPDDADQLAQLDPDTLNGVQINLTEWLLAEGAIQVQGTNRRIADYLIGPAGPSWTAGQREWLAQLAQRPLRLYDVTEVVPGQRITLCDSLSDDAAPMVVLERSGSQNLEPGMVIGCRVMRVGEHFELSGAAYPFSILAGPMVAQRLRATALEFGHLPGLAQEQGMVLMSSWLQQFVAAPPMPTLIDHYSGEPVLLITDHYQVLDEDALAGALQGCADVQGDRQRGWSRIMDCDDGQIRPLAHVNPSKESNQIEVFYKTQAYADRGRAWFDAVTAGTLTFLSREVNSPQSVLNRSEQPGVGVTPEVGRPDITLQEFTQAVAELIQRSYANWADEPIPALNHKTPRQAIQTAAGLERVKGLLRRYEASEKTQAAKRGRAEICYDFLWQSIGVSR